MYDQSKFGLYIVSTKRKRGQRRESTTSTNIIGRYGCGRTTLTRRSHGSFVGICCWNILLLIVLTVIDRNKFHHPRQFIPSSLLFSPALPLVTAIMTDTRNRNRQEDDNEWDHEDYKSHQDRNYYRQSTQRKNHNMRSTGRQQQQQQQHNSQYFFSGEFHNRNEQQYHQQQHKHNRRPSNPFETFSQYLLQNDSATTTNTKRKKLLSLFPTHKPRHIIDGLVTLARSVFVGFGLGLISFISVPVAEYLRLQQEQKSHDTTGTILDHTVSKSKNRWLGLLIGGINGALFGSTFVVVGLVNGCYQAMRGLIYTPIAIRAIRKGMIWDINREIWKLYYLTEELDELESFQPFQDGSRAVQDLTYYNMLNVQITANANEIKRAYRKKARDVHPDKNLGNQSAADEFRKLNAAYLTLSDTDKRSAYDRWGRSTEKGDNDGSDDAPGIDDFDPNIFFTILLNTKPVEKYIGNSAMASFTKQSMLLWRSSNGDSRTSLGESLEDVFRLLRNDNPQSSHIRRRRQLNIALHLNEKVSAYINDTVSLSEFRTQCRQEAIEIAHEPFGVKYLYIIGRALTLESDRYTITNTKVFGKLLSKVMSMRHKLATVKSTGYILREIFNTAKLVKENELTIDDEAYLMQLVLPVMFEIGWTFHEIDIKHAIHRACTKLFADASVNDLSKRLKRAKTIRILAEEFLLVAQQEMERLNHSDMLLSSDDLSARIEVAANMSVLKASGFDVPSDTEVRIQNAKAKRDSERKNT